MSIKSITMECDEVMKSNKTNDNQRNEDVHQCSAAQTQVEIMLVLSLWNLACNKLNGMYGGDTSKVRKVYDYVMANKEKSISHTDSEDTSKKSCEHVDKCDEKESEGIIENEVKVIGTKSTDMISEKKNDGNESHSDTETDQSTSKSCTSFETKMSSDSESESSSDLNNDDTESPVFIPNKESSSKTSLIQSKEKLKEIDISDDSVEIEEVNVKVKIEPDDMDTLKPIKKPPLIDITNSDNIDDISYNKSSMEAPSGNQITGDKGNIHIKNIFVYTKCLCRLSNKC